MLQPDSLLLFHGDSITQQNLYTLYLESYLLTCHPHTRLRFYNAGWKAHRADEGLDRFDRDVAAHGPQLVTLLFGSNDAMARPFEPFHLARYREALTGLVDRVRAMGAEPIVITAPVVDMDSPPPRPRRNEILAELAAEAAAVATAHGVALVDLFGPMQQIQAAAKAQDPNFTFLPDGVHPDPVGHLAMAALILRALGWLTQEPAVSLLPGATEATVPARIPFPLDPEAATALTLLPAVQEMIAWRLVAPGLAPGSYEVFLNESSVGLYTGEALATGVDLRASLPPDLQRRSDEVLQLGRDRFRFQYEGWRGFGTAAALPDGWLAVSYGSLAEAAERTRQLAAQPVPIHVRLHPVSASV